VIRVLAYLVLIGLVTLGAGGCRSWRLMPGPCVEGLSRKTWLTRTNDVKYCTIDAALVFGAFVAAFANPVMEELNSSW